MCVECVIPAVERSFVLEGGILRCPAPSSIARIGHVRVHVLSVPEALIADSPIRTRGTRSCSPTSFTSAL
jgi:hypothetical protein